MFQIDDVLKKVPLFQVLDKEGIHFIVERLALKRYGAGEVLCHAGDPGDKMFILISGRVKVVVYSEDGEENIIAYLGRGDYFGEMALLTGEARSASVITTEPSEMHILSKADFDEVIERYPSITLSMSKVMSQRLRNTLYQTANKPGRITAVEGELADKSLADILQFCEKNALNGTLTLSYNGSMGKFLYRGGELQKVQLRDLSEDKALDEMLGWKDGHFSIQPEPVATEKLGTTKKTIDLTAADPAPSGSEKRRLLIVNNSIVVQKVLQQTFEQLGFEVYAVETAEKTRNLVQTLHPHLIISGTKLPDATGVDILKMVREKSNVPYVFLTEKRNKALIQSQTKNFANVFYTNSQEVPEIRQVVAEALQVLI